MPPRLPDGAEQRASLLEVRAGSGRQLHGYAAVWNTEARIADAFTETVRRGAFTASLASGTPIYLLSQHDMANPLARTGQGGTLDLAEDDKGLRFAATVAETRAGDDILALARAGILGGMSVGFTVPQGGDVWSAADRRELVRVELIELSAVTSPAYAGTTVSARALEHARTSPSRRLYAARLAALEL